MILWLSIMGINLNIENKKKIYGWARHDYSLSYFNELDNIEKIDEAFNYAIKKNRNTK